MLSDPEDFLRRKHVPTVRTHDSLLQTYMDGGEHLGHGTVFLGMFDGLPGERNPVGSIAYHEEVYQPRRRFAICEFLKSRKNCVEPCLSGELTPL